jgi:starch phosphorylase
MSADPALTPLSARPADSVDALCDAITNRLLYQVGKDTHSATPQDWLFAVVYAVRDRLIDVWRASLSQVESPTCKRVYYLSMEFLTGRALTNALLAADILQPVKQACAKLGTDFDALVDLEPDAGLGNGGLGRLAACFLDSMATLGLSGIGYGIRYEFGMFAQRIEHGQQVEEPDYWLVNGYPWEFLRPEISYTIRFNGRVSTNNGKAAWIDTEEVIATAYDSGVPGCKMRSVVTMRLWSARATRGVNLDAFNRGDYIQAVEAKNASENVTRVLYPDDRTEHGKELRLRQEYFFVSASLQDILRRHLHKHGGLSNLEESVAIHLNDTHPALAVPELLRLLLDEHHLDLDAGWSLCKKVFSYTNHTLMAEALETWPVELLARVLPRHMGLIYDLNARFLIEVHNRIPNDNALMRRISLIEERGTRRVRMAHMAAYASHKINGVSVLHSQLMVETIFSDFARMYPERFCNKTNGISPRRWLSLANPRLSALLDEHIGVDWRSDLDQLAKLRPLADQPEFQRAFQLAKQDNKDRLAKLIEQTLGITVDPHSMFDVQVKRIHEYKRQLLNLLHVVTRYYRILAQPDLPWVARTVVFSGKAASSYYMAKLIIHLVNDVAHVINNDARIGTLLRVAFIPNYRVSLAEVIIPAADLSQQISTAGTEASGTGNMKLALNGALTIGTWDGANIEIAGQVGLENIFVFGNTAEKVMELRGQGYQPRALYDANFELKFVIDRLAEGAFSPDEPLRYRDIVNSLLDSDYYQLLADYAAYVACQEKVDALYLRPAEWTRSAILNVAGMGAFSSDRTMREYASEIWNIHPCVAAPPHG